MSGSESRRHCEQCDQQVVHLSMLSEAEARRILEAEERPCVRYLYGEDGEVIFAGEQLSARDQLRRQKSGVRRLLGAAALVVPLLMVTPGCEPEQPREVDLTQRAVAVEPDGGNREGASAELTELRARFGERGTPGAGRRPVFGQPRRSEGRGDQARDSADRPDRAAPAKPDSSDTADEPNTEPSADAKPEPDSPEITPTEDEKKILRIVGGKEDEEPHVTMGLPVLE